MEPKNPKILVTGGAGFIGSNLVPKLLGRGYQVVVVDNCSGGDFSYLPEDQNLLKFDIDLSDKNGLTGVFESVDSVIHLAAKGSVVDSVKNPQVNFETNVVGTFNVLCAAVAAGVKRILFSSTGGALIGNAVPPVNEESLPKPISPYGASKLCGEAYLHAFACAYNIECIALRFANVYGPNSQHKSGVFNAFTKSLVRGEPLTVFGDGSSTRDYIHVDDLCSGILLALESKAVLNDVLHIATGKETSLLELADLFLKENDMGREMLKFLPPRHGEVERNFARYDRANKTIGYAPKISLDIGVADTFKFLKDFY